MKYEQLTADGPAAGPNSNYYGYTVSVVIATAAVSIRDASAAGAGKVIDVIPIGTAAGARGVLPVGIRCSAGIYADYGSSGTGTVNIVHD